MTGQELVPKLDMENFKDHGEYHVPADVLWQMPPNSFDTIRSALRRRAEQLGWYDMVFETEEGYGLTIRWFRSGHRPNQIGR